MKNFFVKTVLCLLSLQTIIFSAENEQQFLLQRSKVPFKVECAMNGYVSLRINLRLPEYKFGNASEEQLVYKSDVDFVLGQVSDFLRESNESKGALEIECEGAPIRCYFFEKLKELISRDRFNSLLLRINTEDCNSYCMNSLWEGLQQTTSLRSLSIYALNPVASAPFMSGQQVVNFFKNTPNCFVHMTLGSLQGDLLGQLYNGLAHHGYDIKTTDGLVFILKTVPRKEDFMFKDLQTSSPPQPLSQSFYERFGGDDGSHAV